MYILIIEKNAIDLNWLKDQMMDYGINASIKIASSFSESDVFLKSIKFDIIAIANSFPDNETSFKKLIEFIQDMPVTILADLSNKQKILETIRLAAQQHLSKDKYKCNTAGEFKMNMSNLN